MSMRGTKARDRTSKKVPLPVELVLDYLDGRIASETEIAEHFGAHHLTVRRKLEGGLARGALLVDEYNEDGERLTRPHWRYTYTVPDA